MADILSNSEGTKQKWLLFSKHLQLFEKIGNELNFDFCWF